MRDLVVVQRGDAFGDVHGNAAPLPVPAESARVILVERSTEVAALLTQTRRLA